MPRSFSLISFVPDCNHNNDGLVRGAELRGLSTPFRASGSSASRSGPCLVRVIKTSRQLSFGDWRGHGACLLRLHHSGREKLRRLGENLALSLLLSCVLHYISLYSVWVFLFLFSFLHIFTGKSWD